MVPAAKHTRKPINHHRGLRWHVEDRRRLGGLRVAGGGGARPTRGISSRLSPSWWSVMAGWTVSQQPPPSWSCPGRVDRPCEAVMAPPTDRDCAGFVLSGVFSGGLVMLLVGFLNGMVLAQALGACLLSFWVVANLRYVRGDKPCGRDQLGRLLAGCGRRLHPALK